MPNFPSLGHNVDAEFMAIVDPASVTHPLPPDGQTPWGDTFRLWSGDVEDSLNNLEAATDQLGDDITVVEGDIVTLQGDITGLDTRVDTLEAGGGPVTVPDASTTVKGIVELATLVEAEAGVSGTLAVTPAALQAVLDTFLLEIFGPGISRLKAITRTAYNALTPKVADTLYIIDETA